MFFVVYKSIIIESSYLSSLKEVFFLKMLLTKSNNNMLKLPLKKMPLPPAVWPKKHQLSFLDHFCQVYDGDGGKSSL